MEKVEYGAPPTWAVILSGLALVTILVCAVLWVLT